MRVLGASLLDLYQNKCQTTKGHQQHHQPIFLVNLRAEFAVAIQKRFKAPGPDSIFPELIIHAGATLKSW